MFYNNAKKNALNEHEKAVSDYNTAYSSLEIYCNALYERRTTTISVLKDIETLINSIANTPKELEKSMSFIQTNREKFKETEKFAKEATDTLKKSGASTAAGVAGGAAIASLAPTAAMWIATTFGTASTGVAISTLSGAAATNAALAWLGGGALAAGGAGMAGGSALLALAGPIGWTIAGVTTATSLFFVGRKNKKIANEAQEATMNILKAENQIKKQVIEIRDLNEKTQTLLSKVNNSFDKLRQLQSQDYLSFSDDEKIKLGALVNNSNALSELLNKTINA